MTQQTCFTVDGARQIGEQIGIDWASAPFDVEQFRMGMNVGTRSRCRGGCSARQANARSESVLIGCTG
jgi:hypothetical protein